MIRKRYFHLVCDSLLRRRILRKGVLYINSIGLWMSCRSLRNKPCATRLTKQSPYPIPKIEYLAVLLCRPCFVQPTLLIARVCLLAATVRKATTGPEETTARTVH